MALTTKIAKHYALRQIIMAIVCLVLGLWGLYDYAIKIPNQQERWETFQALTEEKAELESQSEQSLLTGDEVTRFETVRTELNALGSAEKPGKLDRLVKGLAFVPCLPFTPYFLWIYARTKRRIYTLDDDGTLHLLEGDWAQAEIADIDMSRWMAKSIAYVVHKEGTRVKLDDYKYRDLHLIVGAIASRLYPEAWDAEAKQIKADQSAEDEDGDENDGEVVTATESESSPTPPEAVS